MRGARCSLHSSILESRRQMVESGELVGQDDLSISIALSSLEGLARCIVVGSNGRRATEEKL
jgi:hypothetical protein